MAHRAIMHPMLSPSLQSAITNIIDLIAQQGYAVVEHFLAPEVIKDLAIQARSLQGAGAMHKAKTGLNAPTQAATIRGDFIHWIEAHLASKAESTYLAATSELQQALNQAFFLGLFELESHFAIYPAGAGYQKHLDQLIGKAERKVSCILYLNENWQPEDGGQLRMYLDQQDALKWIDIFPQAGTLVVFLSSDFLHEVLPAKRERISITGWFRTRGLEI